MRILRLVRFGLKYLLGYKVDGIGLILTRRCNLNCPYCKIKSNSNSTKLSVSSWKKIIDKFVENKHIHFIFTGGEPLLYKDLPSLINYASKKSITSLITNATLINPEYFKKMKNLDYLTFSIDELFNKNGFEKCPVDKLEMIKINSAKYGIETSAIITINSQNIDDVPSIIKKVNSYGIPVLLSLLHSDEGNYDFRSYVPDLEFKTQKQVAKLRELEMTLLRMKKEGYMISENNDFIKNMANYVTGKFKIQCPAANYFFTINNDGFIKACHDMKPSKINALEFKDYGKMRIELKKTIMPSCNCYYDCYFNKSLRPKQFLNLLLRRLF
ncbi:MAG: radical SAM protein [Nanobdellota archaeon]